jgi:hypothetical protein
VRERREKLKVVEVTSLHCLDREPRPGAQDNRWVAGVKVEVRGAVYAHPPRIAQRMVTVIAKDELEAFTKLLTEGA